ncbi:hypothetical protein NDU88_003009 [Pleurodeles waltl]|uniref:Uncharacterized protein n=1 Tax=Pleurodeles waltl TaxID=8319 RepID=A0AAV7M7L6_PLEWA|nr:hypothetical protein NDU88_003009 [Pleurodeles waltl]
MLWSHRAFRGGGGASLHSSQAVAIPAVSPLLLLGAPRAWWGGELQRPIGGRGGGGHPGRNRGKIWAYCPHEVGRSRFRAPTSLLVFSAAYSPTRPAKWRPQLSAPIRSTAAPPLGRPITPGAASEGKAAPEAYPGTGMLQRRPRSARLIKRSSRSPSWLRPPGHVCEAGARLQV